MKNLPHLDQFKVIAEEKKINKAAKILNISQPGLTKNVKKLELLLNTQLFIRTNDGLKLTAHGVLLYNHACIIHNENRKVLNLLQNTEQELVQEIKILGGYVWNIIYLPHIVPTIMKKLPNIKMTLGTGLEKNLYVKLKNNECDIIFAALPNYLDTNISFIPKKEIYFTIFAPKKHTALNYEIVHLNDLEKYNFVYHKNVNDSFDAKNITPHRANNIKIQTSSLLSAIRIAKSSNLLISLPITFKDFLFKYDMIEVKTSIPKYKFMTGILFKNNALENNNLKSIIDIIKKYPKEQI